MPASSRIPNVKLFMFPFHKQPPTGIVRVFMKDGTERRANTCYVESSSFSGLQWFCMKTRKAIDVNLIKGWLPKETG